MAHTLSPIGKVPAFFSRVLLSLSKAVSFFHMQTHSNIQNKNKLMEVCHLNTLDLGNRKEHKHHFLTDAYTTDTYIS